MRNYLTIVLISGVLLACSIEPQKIDYGKDSCSFCKMVIVDRFFATQLVTKKGKSFKYDAIECMLYDLQQEKDQNKMALLLVTDYTTPEKFIEVKQATFMISDSIKSPMGANVAAFESVNSANAFISTNKNGKKYNWNELEHHFSER